MTPHNNFSAQTGFGITSGSEYIAYLALPLTSRFEDPEFIFSRLRGVKSWEIDGSHCAYFLLYDWMGPQRIHELYGALRQTYGTHIRFGAARQKTTARAAALFRPVPHCTIVTPQNTDVFLSQLPIRLLPGLGQRTTRFLENQGITTFTAFRLVPAQTLKDWFGVSGLILQQFARGLDPRVVTPA